jgi:hypothetical protein
MDGSNPLREFDPIAIDIVVADAACASGLPGMGRLDAGKHVRRVNDVAASCQRFTDRVMTDFCAGRCDYPGSESRFRIQAMVTHLQRDLGLRYHPDRRGDEQFRPEDSFLHGILFGRGGTCGSMPLLYATVGRRLGYPIKLVTTRNHLFCRWEGDERFNIEASGDGVSFFPDEHYRTGPFAMPPETILACGYLESLAPREEFACLLTQRGDCWLQEKNYGEATTSFAWANEVDPRRMQHRYLTQNAIAKWDQDLRNRLPPMFPWLDLGMPPPQFRELQRHVEREIVRMLVMERLLADPELEYKWWAPARRNPITPPPGFPKCLRIDYRWDQPIAISQF